MTVLDVALRRKHRVAVTLSPPPKQGVLGAEYEGEKLLIDKVIAARCDIVKGAELSEADLSELIYVSECYRAKERAIWHLSGQDYSEKGLYNKLIKTFTPKAAAFAIAQMQKKGFINDEKYAANLVLKFKSKNLSKRQMAEKLMQNGISKEISNKLLKVDEDLSATDVSRAAELLKAKYINKIGDEEGRKKTFAALMRRGFSYSDIKKAFELVLRSDDFEEEIF